MRVLRSVLVVLLAMLGALVLSPAIGIAEPDDTAAVLAPALADLEAQLGKPATLVVTDLTVIDGWAFVWADIREPDGEWIDYTDTPFAEMAAHGAKSKKYVGLLRYDGARWTLVDSLVGPTDVGWELWADEYGAPAEIFVTS